MKIDITQKVPTIAGQQPLKGVLMQGLEFSGQQTINSKKARELHTKIEQANGTVELEIDEAGQVLTCVKANMPNVTIWAVSDLLDPDTKTEQDNTN